MITIDVRLFAILRKYRPEAPSGELLNFPIEEGTTLDGLLAKLGIPAHETRQVFVNGQQADSNYILQQGDRVGIFPPIAGGLLRGSQQ
ncbi:MAG: MoaD/ThiS family protein [Chloroflexi bacterium]|nr:MoaD/ThiS family protein [Chloroflexota bacterium]